MRPYLYRYLKPIVLISFVALTCGQFFQWQSYAVEVSFYQLKNITLGLTEEDALSWGAICNSLEKYKCSINIFNRVLYNKPGHLPALGNLAVAYSKLELWREALRFYESYVALGGMGYDVMGWYARSLVHLEQMDKALYWYYQSVALNPERMGTAFELIDHLVSMNLREEALSVIGSLTLGDLESNKDLRRKYLSIEKDLQNEESLHKSILRLPSFYARSHYLPVRFGGSWAGAGYVPMLVDRGSEKTYVAEKYMPFDLMSDPNQARGTPIRGPAEAGSEDGESQFIFTEAMIGVWSFSDVEIQVCKRCPPRVGQVFLDNFDIEVYKEGALEFIQLVRAN